MTSFTNTLNLRAGVFNIGERAMLCFRTRFTSDFGTLFGVYRVSATCRAYFIPFVCITTFTDSHFDGARV